MMIGYKSEIYMIGNWSVLIHASTNFRYAHTVLDNTLGTTFISLRACDVSLFTWIWLGQKITNTFQKIVQKTVV